MPGLLGSILIDGHEDRPNQLGHGEYVQLRRNLEKLVSDGRVRKIAPFNPLYGGDDEEWYLDVEGGEIYALLPLSERVVPIWEKVDAYDPRNRKQKEVDWRAQMGKVEQVPGYLAQIPKGRQDSRLLQYLRYAIETWIKAGAVETVETVLSPAKAGTSEEWYRDKTTGEIYGLIHNENGEFWWEKAPSRSDEPSVQ
jgi:hypothetical protein